MKRAMRSMADLADIDGELCIDATNSTHFSRFINHAEHGVCSAAQT
jgi:hypothetical protein